MLSVSQGLKEGNARRDAIFVRAFIGLEYWGKTLYWYWYEISALANES